jgi:hypothetical protein
MFEFFSRGAVVALSALSVAGAIKLAPGPAQSAVSDAAPRPLPSVIALAAERVAPVPVRRDPFAEPAAPSPQAAAPPAARTLASEKMEPLPSNLPNDTIPALPGSAPDTASSGPRVTAVVTGPHPYAMLETGGVHEIKGLGDAVGGVAIAAISIDGVRLRDGRRLAVDPAAQL